VRCKAIFVRQLTDETAAKKHPPCASHPVVFFTAIAVQRTVARLGGQLDFASWQKHKCEVSGHL